MTKRELQEENEQLREKLEQVYDTVGDALGFDDDKDDRSGPTPLNSRPSFLSGVSADAYAASLPVGSITVYASSGVCLSRLECGLD